jgi:RNA polymerase sigma factor (sigma-70 family)
MNLDETVSSRWFVEEVQVHAASLRAWLRGRYPVLSDPDNVVQESLTRVWRAAQGGQVRSPKALLFTTASHLALDELRRRKIAPFESLRDDEQLSVYAEDTPTPDDVAHREELSLLTQAIQSLPPRCREALILRKRGLPQKEIAARLGVTERTVEAHLVKGLRGCAKFLARFGLP